MNKRNHLSLFPPSNLTTLDFISFGLMVTEIAIASTMTIWLRNLDWANNWTNPDRRSRAEEKRMFVEKVDAAAEVYSEWQRFILDVCTGGVFDPLGTTQKMLAPIHRKATANARRLIREKR